jgi:peptide/nickel transport system permease protein
MLDALQSDYVKVARAKGVPESSILFRHALRNASIPALTVAGTIAASLINGALVVETVFGWPGVGQLMVQAIENRDFAVIQAVIFVTAGAIIVLNFLVDLGYMWLNPQIRFR